MQHHALKAETIFVSRINLTLAVASPWDFLNIRETNYQQSSRAAAIYALPYQQFNLKGTVHNKNLIYLIFPVAYGAIYPAKSFYIEQFGSRLSGDGKKTALAR